MLLADHQTGLLSLVCAINPDTSRVNAPYHWNLMSSYTSLQTTKQGVKLRDQLSE
jgi:hypothetical protein